MLSFLGHGDERLFVFGSINDLGNPSGGERQLSDEMIAYWTTFARTGNPNAQGLLNWPEYRVAMNSQSMGFQIPNRVCYG